MRQTFLRPAATVNNLKVLASTIDLHRITTDPVTGERVIVWQTGDCWVVKGSNTGQFFSEYRSRRRAEALCDHLVGVRAEPRGRQDAVERGAHQPLARRVVAAPLPQWLHQPRRGRRVGLVEGEHLVAEKPVTLAARGVKMQRVGLREG